MSKFRIVAALRPDNTQTFEKPYSWAIQSYSGSDWFNVKFGRSDSHDDAWSDAKKAANEIEIERSGRLMLNQKKFSLIPVKSLDVEQK